LQAIARHRGANVVAVARTKYSKQAEIGVRLAKCGGLGDGAPMELFKGWSGVFYMLGLIGAGMIIETLFPWRRAAVDLARWLRNASMMFYSMIILSLFPVIAAYGVAIFAQSHAIGLFNLLSMPYWLELILCVVILDALAFAEHRVLHRWYFFWRIHRVHHLDLHVDATTSIRFHPFEAVFRALIGAGVVLALGLAPEGILLAFAVTAFANTFTHMNITLPTFLERALSTVFVTPTVHRLHHSVKIENQYSNFGTIFCIWDRITGAFRNASHLTADEIFGVSGNEKLEEETFGNLMLDPFRTPKNTQVPRPAPIGVTSDNSNEPGDQAP